MDLLEIHCRGKVLFAKIECVEKAFRAVDFQLIGKDGISLYIFRKEDNKWRCAYGALADDIKESVIDALILRYEPDVIKVFTYKGERQVVKVSFAIGAACWHVNINGYYIGCINYNEFNNRYLHHIHNESWLLPRHMEKFIEMIKSGQIKGPHK